MTGPSWHPPQSHLRNEGTTGALLAIDKSNSQIPSLPKSSSAPRPGVVSSFSFRPGHRDAAENPILKHHPKHLEAGLGPLHPEVGSQPCGMSSGERLRSSVTERTRPTKTMKLLNCRARETKDSEPPLCPENLQRRFGFQQLSDLPTCTVEICLVESTDVLCTWSIQQNTAQVQHILVGMVEVTGTW